MDFGQYAITAYNIHSSEKKIVVKLTQADSLDHRVTKFQYVVFDPVPLAQHLYRIVIYQLPLREDS